MKKTKKRQGNLAPFPAFFLLSGCLMSFGSKSM